MKQCISSLLLVTGYLALFWPAVSSADSTAISKSSGQVAIKSFDTAKEILKGELYQHEGRTLYCGASMSPGGVTLPPGFNTVKYDNRSRKLEWEHVVPVSNFGRNLNSWVLGHPACTDANGESYEGRRCARKVSREFQLMESDLYNLYPAIGAVNAMRSDHVFGELPNQISDFWGCDVRIHMSVMQPPESARGRISRAYLYMAEAYPDYVRLSAKQRELMHKWDAKHPVSKSECIRADLIREIQGNHNHIMASRCKDWYELRDTLAEAFELYEYGEDRRALQLLNGFENRYLGLETYAEDVNQALVFKAFLLATVGDYAASVETADQVIYQLGVPLTARDSALFAEAINHKTVALLYLEAYADAKASIALLLQADLPWRDIHIDRLIASSLVHKLFIANLENDDEVGLASANSLLSRYWHNQDQNIQEAVLHGYYFKTLNQCNHSLGLVCKAMVDRGLRHFEHLKDTQIGRTLLSEMRAILTLMDTSY